MTTPTLREAAQAALIALTAISTHPTLDMSDFMRGKINAAIDAMRSALAAQPAPDALQEPDMRHPKIQTLIGAKARREIELSIVEDLLDDPNCDVSSMCMEYWNSMHDRLKTALTEPLQPAAPDASPSIPDEIGPQDWHESSEQKLSEQGFCDGWNACRKAMLERAALIAPQAGPAQMPDLSARTERGAVAWAGVNAQELREGWQAEPAQQFAPDWAGYRQGVSDGAAQARQPLTDEQIRALVQSHGTGGWQTSSAMAIFARAIEAAHGITAAQKRE